MAKLKESETFKEIMGLSQGVIGKKHLAEGFILKLLRNTKNWNPKLNKQSFKN